jgi:uncharacterized protein (TIGR02001 family)
MARQNTALGMLKTSIAGVALLAGFAAPALADDKLTFSGSAALTTDYVFRGVSQTDENGAIQGEFDAGWKMFYLGVWGSNLNFGGAQTQSGQLVDVAQLEADWYGGIRPVWKGITFDIGGIYYSYPNSYGPAHLDYFELKTGGSYTFFDKLTLGLFNYYSPNNTGDVGRNDVLEFDWAYAFNKVWGVTPTLSGVYGRQWADSSQGGVSYNYVNVGLTVGFWATPALSADVRFWDTDLDGCGAATIFQCGPRVVGTLKAAF